MPTSAPKMPPPESLPQAEIGQLIALFNEGRHAELEDRTRLLIRQYPDSGFVWKVLGVALNEQGKEALSVMQKATKLLPGDADAHSNLGNALKDLGRHDDAVASYRLALKIKPDFDKAHNNLGNVLRGVGKLEEAVVSCRRALEIKPDYSEAHNNLGNALKDLGRLNDAIACYERALEVRPSYAEAHSNMGNAMDDLGRLDDSVASYQRALAIKPDYAEVYVNLGAALQDLGHLDDAMVSCHRALEIKLDLVEAHSTLLFTHNYMADLPAVMLLSQARKFGDLAEHQAHPCSNWRNIPYPEKCLRVGLVSGDLRTHPVGYFIEGVLAALASNSSGRLELTAYSNHLCTDALTERIKACCQGWRSSVGLSDETLARLIREDGIDILIDLSGHTARNRLLMFAWKPAPVQVSWLGYFATTGVAAIDYLIADPWTLPEPEEIYFTEKIWRLPETRLCFTPPEVGLEVSPLSALTNGYITFGCFNNLSKMNDDVVALWARILASVPDSRLLLKAKQLNSDSVRQNTIERFVAHEIDENRLILEGSEPRKEYLAAYHRVDIALDPFPYTGGTTTVEGLWMGVPVLTLAGKRFLSRQGVGILMNAGLSEWIADDAEDYVARAVAHASDLKRLAKLRSGLRQQTLASPIFDAPRFAKNFEAALRGMWKKWCDGKTS